MAKDEAADKSPIDELSSRMRNNLRLKSSSAVSNNGSHPLYFNGITNGSGGINGINKNGSNKKHRLSPNSMSENQNRSKNLNTTSSNTSSVDMNGHCSSDQQSSGSSVQYPYDHDDQEVNGTCRLLREGSLIKEAVKRLQTKHQRRTYHQHKHNYF